MEGGSSTASEWAVLMLKQRRDMTPGISAKDDYIEARLDAAQDELRKMGISIGEGASDQMLLVDYASWQYANRDKKEGTPAWLKDRLRTAFMSGGEQE